LYIDWEWNYEGVSRDSLFALGFSAAERALERDPLTPEAWLVVASLQMHRNPRDFTTAVRAFEHALAIDPNDARVLHGYAALQTRLGNLQAAANLEHRALANEPGRPISLFILFEVAYRSREYQEAITWLDSALVVEPGFFFAYAFRGLTRLRLGDFDGAQDDGQTSARFSAGVDVPGITVLALVDVARGDTASAGSRLDRLEGDVAARDGGTSQDALWLAMIETALGQAVAALDRLESVPDKSAEFSFWLMLPEFDALRDNPRFQRLFEETRPRIEEPGLIA
jgi:tetratricopeptide (TPR) repeat protein